MHYHQKGRAAQRHAPSNFTVKRNVSPTACLLTALLALSMMLSGCVTTGGLPARLPHGDDTKFMVLAGNSFEIAAAERMAEGERVTVFIEGDGRPWIAGGRQVSQDPTPRRTPMLQQFLEAPAPALYLGRPCYFGMGPEEECHPALWTFSRYSPRVLGAMEAAIMRWQDMRGADQPITLIGHSGGGVLALLLAERMSGVDRVITYGAPVDIDHWSDMHGHTPLFDSMNPAEQNEWRNDVKRTLVFGEHDRQVPPQEFADILARIPGAKVIILPGVGHNPPAHKSLEDREAM